MEQELRSKQLVTYLTPTVAELIHIEAKACGFRFPSSYIGSILEGIASQDFTPYGFAKVAMRLNDRKEELGIPMTIKFPFTGQPLPKLAPTELSDTEIRVFVAELKAEQQKRKAARNAKIQIKEKNA